jgi:hypothetical protein
MTNVSEDDALRSYLHTLGRRELRWLRRGLQCPVAGSKDSRVSLIDAILAYAERAGIPSSYIRTLMRYGEIIGYPRVPWLAYEEFPLWPRVSEAEVRD